MLEGGQAHELIVDDEGNLVTTEYLRSCFDEWIDMILFLYDVESGLVTFSVKEYFEMPVPFTSARRIYKQFIRPPRKKEK